MSLKLTIALVVLAVTGTGCATMFTGTSQPVAVSSNPSGARVFVNGSYFGVTPVSVLLNTRSDYDIILQHEGFQDTTVTVARRFNPVALLNVVNIVFWLIDLSTGALWRLDRAGVFVNLLPVQYPIYELPPPRNGWPGASGSAPDAEPPSVPFESAPPPFAPEPPQPEPERPAPPPH